MSRLAFLRITAWNVGWLLVYLGICGLVLSSFSCAPTYRAIVRRTEGDRLSRCMRIWNGPECVADSVRRCRAAELERDCATDKSWGQ